jgi:hypothetical protein
MKKFTTIALIALLATGILFLTYCSKEYAVDPAVNQNECEQMAEADFAVMNKLVAFRDKVQYFRENPGYKSGEMLTPEDAVWNLETLFNATYGFPDEQYGRTKSDTVVLYIDINSIGDILLDDVVAMYDDLIALVTQYYYNSGYDQKGFLLLHLTQGDISYGQMEIELRAVTGEKSDGWQPFSDDDSWWFCEHMGDCNWNNPGIDAADTIAGSLMAHKPLVSPPPGYRFVYGPNEVINLFGHEYLNENNEYLIFYIEREDGNFTWEDKCLHLVNEVNELNFHFWGEKTVIYDILPQELNKPANWTFMECSIVGEYGNSQANQNVPCIRHKTSLTYAMRHLVPKGIIPPPVEL